MHQRADVVVALNHFFHGPAFFGQGAGGTGLNALSAVGTGAGFAPFLVEVADNARVHPPRTDLPDVSPFQFGADSYATRAEDAPVVIEDEARVRQVDGQARKVVGEADGIDPHGGRHRLQLAVAVGDADGAGVVAFDEQQFESHAAVPCQLGGFRGNRHAVLDRRGAGRKQAIDSGDLDDAETAGAYGGQALEVAKRWNKFAARLCRLEDG